MSDKPETRRIVIEPVTRVEGHGKVTILLDDEAKVKQARLHIVEFRGFERFIQGRPFWEVLPQGGRWGWTVTITVCSEADPDRRESRPGRTNHRHFSRQPLRLGSGRDEPAGWTDSATQTIS